MCHRDCRGLRGYGGGCTACSQRFRTLQQVLNALHTGLRKPTCNRSLMSVIESAGLLSSFLQRSWMVLPMLLLGRIKLDSASPCRHVHFSYMAPLMMVTGASHGEEAVAEDVHQPTCRSTETYMWYTS